MRQVQKVTMICVVAAALASLVGCATVIPEADRLTTVDALDLDRYLGSWYEIAR
ncbi:MAG: lipocalin, partial [Bacilli bacterium]|nr:lipocalin [Bacilli bacterium]